MPGAELSSDVWINEYVAPDVIHQHGIQRVLASARTPWQQMYIVESDTEGKALVLDGKWQSCTADEFLYHEPLVHPACLQHGQPKQVLVLGGGEGATVREALRWKSVERVVMVDIDGQVVEACKEHLPEMHQGAFEDPRTQLVVGDALAYLDDSEGQWDVIISDLSDPIDEGPSFPLFTKDYFEKCRRALRDGGVFVVQAGPVAPTSMSLHVRLVNTVKAVFPHVVNFCSWIPGYAQPWGFAIGCEAPIDTRPNPEAIDALLARKTTGCFRMFDGRTLLGLYQPPKYLRDAIAKETRIFTLKDPAKFFGSGVASHT